MLSIILSALIITFLNISLKLYNYEIIMMKYNHTLSGYGYIIPLYYDRREIQMDNFNLDLFNEVEEEKQRNSINVAQLEFLDSYSTNWIDLFSGFKVLYAITFSSQLSFIEKVIEKFEYVEIIFGNESVIGNDITAVFSYQHQVITQINNAQPETRKAILDRIDNGTLILWVAKKQLSHEKIFLLSGNTKKVITGSANLSYAAFNGNQRETINEISGVRAFDYYLEQFEILKQCASNKIEAKHLREYKSNILDNLETLPITEEIKQLKEIDVISHEPQAESNFSYSVLKHQENLKKYLPFDNKKEKITFNQILTWQNKIKMNSRYSDVDKTDQLPQLEIDYFQKKVYLLGKELDLHPRIEDVKKDIELFKDFMKGYDSFNGNEEDIELAKERYFAFANWFFISPILSHLRLLAFRHNKKPDLYPIFGLLYGNSKAGKTSFLSTLLYFMIKGDPKFAGNDFTTKTINDIRLNTKGIPIIYDDMVSSQFNSHAGKVVKNDSYGLFEGLDNYPAIVISANEDVKVITQDLTRRIVTCRVTIGLDTTRAMKSNAIRRIQKNITTALYRYYLGLVLERLDDFVSPMHDDHYDESVDAIKFSSDILVEIFSTFGDGELPRYVRELSIDDYFDEKVTSTYAIKAIQTAWKFNRDRFSINKKRNILSFAIKDQHEINRIRKELPDSLQAKVSHDTLIMDLAKAKDFFEIEFKNASIFSRIKG